MSKPSYWALFIDKTAIFRLLNRHLLQCFLMEPSLKSFSSLQMFNRLNTGERKAGGKRERVLGRDGKDPLAPFPLSSPTLFLRLSRRLHPLPIFSVVYSLVYTSSQFTCYVLIILAAFKAVWVEPPGFSILCSSIKRSPTYEY